VTEPIRESAYGWLEQWPYDTCILHGISVPDWSAREQAPFPTRRAEYGFAITGVRPLSRILDAGAGFNPEIHLLPEILANCACAVVAVDENPSCLYMPPIVSDRGGAVQRVVGNICDLPALSETYDVWLCISTLEHMSLSHRLRCIQEGYRVLKPGGLAVVTTDETEPSILAGWLRAARFEVGIELSAKGPLTAPRVAWAIARRAENTSEWGLNARLRHPNGQ
jgi:ubiquinone/menaquinone biosynthesis C-methylase UbiE